MYIYTHIEPFLTFAFSLFLEKSKNGESTCFAMSSLLPLMGSGLKRKQSKVKLCDL